MTDQTRVLVVDDEFLPRLLLVDALQAASFDVVEASSADEAIRIMERRDDISAVFTDIQMPGSMDGIALAHYVRSRWPPTRLIVISARRKPQANELPAGARFLSKPHQSNDLEIALRDVGLL